ncbi:hypothetical protein [Adlercreutzia faecimuris]|uniref:Uncharacterized protein n=1 Tax=Adlercreutzia faecimuris TaxID=2897341 RepID=A0ABS9WFF8_9ACTN|nr:hypothetical protein [Adlercreutzia sp. JBNU-10]MCI2241505.1 hypothetical protein [Adlercreutzia sp. JBNU-10]
MTLLEVARIAAKHETEIAHACLQAVAWALSRGRPWDDPVGAGIGDWGLSDEDEAPA